MGQQVAQVHERYMMMMIELAALLISSESVNDFEKHIHYAVTR